MSTGHAALSSIVAVLKGPEYIGPDARKRMLLHAEVLRRELERLDPDGTARWRTTDNLVDRIRKAEGQ